MRLKERDDELRLRFSNGISLRILKRGTTFGGLGEAWLGRRKLRSAELPIMPLIETPDGYRVCELHFREVAQGRESLTIDLTPHVQRGGRTEWPCSDGQDRWDVDAWERAPVRDRGGLLRVTLRAVQRTLGGVPFVGFSYSYKFRSRKHRAYRIHDRATWELGGRATGNSFWMQGPLNAPQKTFKNKDDGFSTAGRDSAGDGMGLQQFLPLFSALQGFTFQFDSRALLITAFEEPFDCRSLFQKSPGQNCLVHWHQLAGDLAGCLEFPALQVLCAEGAPHDVTERVDQYCAVREELHRQYAEHLGLGREGPLTSGRIVADGGLRPDDLKRSLTELAHAACERVYVPALMHDLGARKPHGDARERVARFVDQAHQRGIEVAVPLGECCRTWLVAHGRAADEQGGADRQRPPDGDALIALALRDPQARKTLLGHLREVKRSLGIDALFADSLADGVADPFDWTPSGKGAGNGTGRSGSAGAPGDAARHGRVLSLDRRRTELVGELQRMGFKCVLAGVGGLASLDGLSSFGAINGREYMFRDCVLAFPDAGVAESGMDPLDAYFRGCANRVSYAALYDPTGTETDRLSEGRRQDYGAVNKAYNAVREYMDSSRLLLKDRGVLWTAADPEVQVLWAYREFVWRVGAEAAVFDLMASKRVDVESGEFAARPSRVYLVQNAAQP